MTFEVNLGIVWILAYFLAILVSYVYTYIENKYVSRRRFPMFLAWVFVTPFLAWIIAPVSVLYFVYVKFVKEA